MKIIIFIIILTGVALEVIKSMNLGLGNKCVKVGCSGQFCWDEQAAKTGGYTDCMFRKEYACYWSAKCERQSNGQCGWTQTPALKSCLEIGK